MVYGRNPDPDPPTLVRIVSVLYRKVLFYISAKMVLFICLNWLFLGSFSLGSMIIRHSFKNSY
jgi:hypothetical protein